MGLSTHVLDTMHGQPASGMRVELLTTTGGQAQRVKLFVLDADGRNPDGPLYDNTSLKAGTYRLVLDVAAYFKARGVAFDGPPNMLGGRTVYSAFFKDPEGYWLEIQEFNEPRWPYPPGRGPRRG